MNKVVIVAARRTPVGSFQKTLQKFTAPELGALVIKDLTNGAKIKPELVILLCLYLGIINHNQIGIILCL